MYVNLKAQQVLMMILSVLVIGSVPGDLAALDDVGSLRCDQESIMTGDTSFQVETTCGKPDSILTKGLAREVWIYNFGPTRFVYYLSFSNGRLKRIQAGEYGEYHDNRYLE
jgi:hypothetical protein